MKPADRRRVLWDIVATYNESTWASVKSWIRDMVRIEPKIMRQVSRATFGDLNSWIQQGSGKVKWCGCLIGTTAIKLAEDRNHFKPVDQGMCVTVGSDKGGVCGPSDVIADLIVAESSVRRSQQALLFDEARARAMAVGLDVGKLGSDVGDDLIVPLIKDEIIRQLAKRRARKGK